MSVDTIAFRHEFKFINARGLPATLGNLESYVAFAADDGVSYISSFVDARPNEIAPTQPQLVAQELSAMLVFSSANQYDPVIYFFPSTDSTGDTRTAFALVPNLVVLGTFYLSAGYTSTGVRFGLHTTNVSGNTQLDPNNSIYLGFKGAAQATILNLGGAVMLGESQGGVGVPHTVVATTSTSMNPALTPGLRELSLAIVFRQVSGTIYNVERWARGTLYNTEGKNDWQPISVRTFDFNGISNIYPQIEIYTCGYASQQSGLIWTSAAATITGLVGTTGLYAGQLVNGTGITAGTTIATVDSPTQITLSQNPASGTGGTLTFGLIQAIGFGTWEVGVAGTNGTLDPQVVSRRKLVMREPYRTTVTNFTVDLNGLVCGGVVLAPNVNGGAPMVVYQSGPGDGIPVSIVAVAANAAGTVWTPTTLMSWADQPTGAHAACGQYPAIELTCSNAGGSVSLITNSDGSRSLTISDSSPQTHTITIPFVPGPAYGQPTITSVASTISGYSGWIATPAGSGSVAADPYVTDGSTGTAIISWMYDQTVSVTSTPAYLLLTPPPNNVSWAWNPKSGTGVMICVRYHTLTSDGNWTTSMHTRTYTPGSGWGNEVMIPQSFWTANFVNGDLAKEVAAPISGFCDAAGNLVFGMYTETSVGEHLYVLTSRDGTTWNLSPLLKAGGDSCNGTELGGCQLLDGTNGTPNNYLFFSRTAAYPILTYPTGGQNPTSHLGGTWAQMTLDGSGSDSGPVYVVNAPLIPFTDTAGYVYLVACTGGPGERHTCTMWKSDKIVTAVNATSVKWQPHPSSPLIPNVDGNSSLGCDYPMPAPALSPAASLVVGMSYNRELAVCYFDPVGLADADLPAVIADQAKISSDAANIAAQFGVTGGGGGGGGGGTQFSLGLRL